MCNMCEAFRRWVNKKVKQPLGRPQQAPRVPGSWGSQISKHLHMKVARLSAIHTGRFYPPGSNPGTHFCYRPSGLQGHCAAGRIMSMKNSSDTTGNRTRDLLICSAVPQPTALVCTPRMGKWFTSNSVCHSHGVEWTKRLLIRLQILINKHSRHQLQIQTHSEISIYVTCNKACPTQWKVASTKKKFSHRRPVQAQRVLGS